MSRATIAVVLVALAGCPSSHPVVPGAPGDAVPGDAGPGDAGPSDAGPDAAPPLPPPNTVVGKEYQICHQLPADVVLPSDLSQSVIQAWIPDNSSATGYRVVTGTGKADGTFTINGVPDGTKYLLQIDSAYEATDQHVLDLHAEQGIRCVPAPATTSVATPVTLDLTGMTPYSASFPNSDFIEIDSYAAGYSGGSSLLSVLHSGDIAISTVYDWLDFADVAPLPDATLGDDVHILHYRSGPAPDPVNKRSHQASYLLDWFPATGVTLQSGVAQTISGQFQPATRNQMVSFSLDRGLFDAGLGTSSPLGPFATISAHPVGFDEFPSATLASFDLSDVSRSTSLVQTISNYAYADPFPASWKRAATVAFFQDRFVRYPDPAHTGFLDTAEIRGFSQLLSEYTGTLATTPVPPAGGVKVGGVDFVTSGNVAFDGRTPVLVSWDPVPTATTYRLDIRRINPPAATERTTFVAIVRTAETSIKVPAELFGGGQFYAFLIMATRTPNDFGAGFLSPIGVPNDFTSYGSGRFRLSPSCGDGTVQAGEDCDTRGESKTCNVDCTVPFCGDGLRNAAAGEACDTVNDTPSCDSDCTLPVCGDGHLNRSIEDCDDGNTTDDGNGCGTDCKFNNVCGNGRVESLVEQCDPGPAVETATCNFNCTLAFCGDGIVNKAAGEECDDGNRIDTDHCSNACKLP